MHKSDTVIQNYNSTKGNQITIFTFMHFHDGTIIFSSWDAIKVRQKSKNAPRTKPVKTTTWLWAQNSVSYDNLCKPQARKRRTNRRDFISYLWRSPSQCYCIGYCPQIYHRSDFYTHQNWRNKAREKHQKRDAVQRLVVMLLLLSCFKTTYDHVINMTLSYIHREIQYCGASEVVPTTYNNDYLSSRSKTY